MPSLQIFHRSTVKTESINRASDQVRHELGCTLTKYSLWLAISDIETKISHNKKRHKSVCADAQLIICICIKACLLIRTLICFMKFSNRFHC